MRSIEAQIPIGKTTFIEGLKIFAEAPIQKPKTRPGGTALHEAMHVIAANENGTGVESATIIPGDGYLGLTKLSRPDAVAAMGPHSMGASGTSFDVFIAGQIGNAGAAESAARGIINSNMDKVEAVASVLEEKGTIGGSEISQAIREVEHPTPQLATIFIEAPTGETQKLSNLEIHDGAIKINEEIVIFEDINPSPQIQ